ncbi:MAG: carbon-nitrogen hydrolase family protein [Alphaproteobacteria bacterium]|jgi:deaminated glutathione amidase|nr:carbon-nitrogen hydrolase family protein [Alphaproteobacteria bacterium]MBT4086036.1 carbon-nitrogen hydrolase family protein [Alphaproteobacteria bacterium]MBT4542204.1 carbon-nitrogen hydrolase family protein [Alphaproteobacteria bacterium]MBT7746210.1 carbon-nitrogen hydrolase family protein [Alphaproteobacteria bacterium]
MTRTFKAACVQVNAQNDLAANTETACRLIREASAAGAEFISLPENVAFMGLNSKETREAAHPQSDHPSLAAFRDVALETGTWLLAGSLGIRLESGKLANRSCFIGPDGQVRTHYDKIHMFDVDLPNGERYRESERFDAGEVAVNTETPWGTLGMTICYDVRFPHLYRALAHAGAEIITVPAAFTRVTGEAHWHVLLRSRAIETGSFVMAAAQCGEHPGKRQTYGHSVIIDPWGKILADAGTEPGFILADIDMAHVSSARAMVPSLQHDREFSLPEKTGKVSAA